MKPIKPAKIASKVMGKLKLLREKGTKTGKEGLGDLEYKKWVAADRHTDMSASMKAGVNKYLTSLEVI